MLDGNINSPVAAGLFELAVVTFLLFYIVKYRLFPRARLDRPFQFGGPWTILRGKFWEDRGLHSKPRMLRDFVMGAGIFAVLFLLFDVIF